nr:hypothetical protein [Rhodococcus sp. USK10]
MPDQVGVENGPQGLWVPDRRDPPICCPGDSTTKVRFARVMVSIPKGRRDQFGVHAVRSTGQHEQSQVRHDRVPKHTQATPGPAPRHSPAVQRLVPTATIVAVRDLDDCSWISTASV